MQRLRKNAWTRSSVRETTLSPERLIQPIFVDANVNRPEPIKSMPGQYRWSPESTVELVRRAEAAHLGGVLLFGRPKKKDENGESAFDPEGPVPRALRLLRGKVSLTLAADVCICAYTRSGHCGIITDGQVDNDKTLPVLAKVAVAYGDAGADWVAPSAMMDGQVAATRNALDSEGLASVAILAYAVKAASSLYEPFREAEDSAPQEGNRKGYQQDYANAREALREMAQDQAEGADILMVKPGVTQLDLLWRAREMFLNPIAVYSVSGEYAMAKAAASNGWLDEKRFVHEMFTSFRRAGADLVISYYALEAAENGWLV